MRRLVVISGCSGGGKSTLLAELARHGHRVVEEPGRRIVREEQASGGTALPWIDLAAFARRAIDLSRADRTAHLGSPGTVFFDRGLVDASVALAHADGTPYADGAAASERYHGRVFLAPPWPELFATDAERRHGLQAALGEYERLAGAYPALGYEVRLLPKTSVAERADFVLRELGG
jgi:predicted ATPase